MDPVLSDPILRNARASMIAARREIGCGVAILQSALRAAKAHPQAADRHSLASWMVSSIRSILDDAELSRAPGWLAHDINTRKFQNDLRSYIDTERRDLARFAKRRKLRAA
jgi:hypothetical protein